MRVVCGGGLNRKPGCRRGDPAFSFWSCKAQSTFCTNHFQKMKGEEGFLIKGRLQAGRERMLLGVTAA